MGKPLPDRHTSQRNMYLPLLLLVPSAFGMPNSAILEVGADVVDQLDSVVGFNNQTQKVLNSFKNLFKEVSSSLKEAERNIYKMDTELKSLQSDQLQFEENYFPKFNEAKQYLRKTRQQLRKLAERTVTEVRDLKVLLEDLDANNDSVLLKAAIDRMKNLMSETSNTLKEAREQYNSAVETFDNLNSSIQTQNRKLVKLVTTDSAEYKAWTEKVRGGTYGTIGALTVGLIIADVFGCLGICSAANVVASASTTAAIESEIATYRAELYKLKEITDKMLESGKNVDKTIDEAIEILTKEIDLINIWTVRADVVSNNIEEYPEEFLKKYVSIRTVFQNGLTDLKEVALDFLAQPIDIL